MARELLQPTYPMILGRVLLTKKRDEARAMRFDELRTLLCIRLARPVRMRALGISSRQALRPALTLILAGTIVVAYTLLSVAFASLGRGGALAPWVSGWGPSIIMLVGLIGLAWRNQVAERMH